MKRMATSDGITCDSSCMTSGSGQAWTRTAKKQSWNALDARTSVPNSSIRYSSQSNSKNPLTYSVQTTSHSQRGKEAARWSYSSQIHSLALYGHTRYKWQGQAKPRSPGFTTYA